MILNYLIPASASTYAADIDRLFDVITLLVGVPFLVVKTMQSAVSQGRVGAN